MKQILILIVLLIFIGCSNKSKKEDLEQIKSLKAQILKQENIIKNIEKSHDNSLESIQSKTKKLEKEKDSLKRLYEISMAIDATINTNQNISHVQTITYEALPNDKYWKRGVYYTSEKEDEYFYNVRTSIINNQLRFYFIGVKQPFDIEHPIGTIYELDENKDLYVVDTINLLPKIKAVDSWQVTLDKETHLQEFMLFQLDNLIVKDGRLYYYKIKEVEKNYLFGNPTKEYYEYIIGTKEKSKKINNTVLSNVIVDTTVDSKILNPAKTKLAVNSGELLDFYEIPNVNKLHDSLYLNHSYTFVSSLPKLDFKLSDFIKLESDDLYTDTDTDKTLLFGGVCWHSRKNVLYFDNSGMTFRCIWKIDFDKNKVTKIVPEHEAIHPFFFETSKREYITYVEKNKIMICEPESNFN